MKRHLLAILVGLTLAVTAAAPVFADAGAPGSTFPEQPGSNMDTACTTVGTSPGAGFTDGTSEQHESSTSAAITGGIITDACFGG